MYNVFLLLYSELQSGLFWTVHYLLWTVHYLLWTVHYLLWTVHYFSAMESDTVTSEKVCT